MAGTVLAAAARIACPSSYIRAAPGGERAFPPNAPNAAVGSDRLRIAAPHSASTLRGTIGLLHGNTLRGRCRTLFGKDQGIITPPHGGKYQPARSLAGDVLRIEPVAVVGACKPGADINFTIGKSVFNEIIEKPIRRANCKSPIARVERVDYDQAATGSKQLRVIAGSNTLSRVPMPSAAVRR